jgi:uncharacterized membrane protein YphA (DoxX/SURF4 family)
MQNRVRCLLILRDLFGIDLRCLAIFRIATALIILADLVLRFPFIVESHTDEGFFPRDLVVSPDCYFSLQMLDGSYAFQLGHFLLAGTAGLMLLAGYRTRLATATCWLLTISLHARNAFLLDAGDDLLRSMLFWSLFLPLGKRYSVDARTKVCTDPQIVLSPASVALLLQFAFVYFFAGVFKTGEAWRNGTAIEYALGQSQWIRPAGEFLRQYPTLMRILTPCVVWFEIIAPLCLFIPFRTRSVRMIVVPMFWLFQFGLATTIWLHLFPLITAIATIPFLSSIIWPYPVLKGQQADELVKVPRRTTVFWNSVFAVLATSIILVQATHFSKSLLPTQERIVSLIGWNAIWSMYSNMPEYSYHFSADATLQDGSTVDLINSEVTEGNRLRVQQFHQSYRIRYFLVTASSDCVDFPARYLTHLVYLWNQTHSPDRTVVRARILGTSKRIGSQEPEETTVLLDVGFSQLPPETR